MAKNNVKYSSHTTMIFTKMLRKIGADEVALIGPDEDELCTV